LEIVIGATMNIKQQKLESFLKDLSSKNPTPGGGVVAALSGVIAASLIEMVGNLTVGKKGYESKEGAVLKIMKDVGETKKKMLKLLDEDTIAFGKVMEAYSMDKEDPERKNKIKKSLQYAIDVPMEVRRLSKDLESCAVKISKIGNRNALSDANTAIHLSQAAQKSALENIKINKESLRSLR
jgi:methenyltetrahydrofolate cyclohydrolase